jgi:hypothetical protein
MPMTCWLLQKAFCKGERFFARTLFGRVGVPADYNMDSEDAVPPICERKVFWKQSTQKLTK